MNDVKQYKFDSFKDGFRCFELNLDNIRYTLHCAGSRDILSLYVLATFRHALKTDSVISPETKTMHQSKSRTAAFFYFQLRDKDGHTYGTFAKRSRISQTRVAAN